MKKKTFNSLLLSLTETLNELSIKSSTFDKHIFKLGDDEQTDIMMKLKLK